MSTQEFAIENETPQPQRRVVEAEIRMPRFEGIKTPDVDLTPIRDLAEQVLLTGLGMGVLAVRGLSQVVKAAYRAGVEELENPGKVTKAVLHAVRPKAKQAAEGEASVKVPMLPIDNYDDLSEDEVIGRLADLNEAALRVIREYETGNARRTQVLEAIATQLQTQ